MIRRFALTFSAGALLAVAGAAPAVLASPHAVQAVAASQPAPTLTAPAGASGSSRAAASTLANVLSVASDSASDTFCGLLSTGHVDCWGHNGSGELGDGSTSGYSPVPVAVEVIGDAATVISGGYYGFCALLSTGHIDCWGSGGSGDLGNGTYNTSRVPVAVRAIGNATAVTGNTDSLGYCALLSTGHVDCWGYNGSGQLGDGTYNNDSDVPVAVAGITDATAVTGDNDGDSYCALLSTGHIDCWGYNGYGELGNGTASSFSDVPVPVKNISTATAVTGGLYGFCARLSTGHVDCWGDNESGELGGGTFTTDSDVPVAAIGITDAKAVTSDNPNGAASYCALLSTSHIDCWGYNEFGELGDGTASNDSDVPVSVKNISTATAVTGGNANFCALLSTSHIDCWGYSSSGQLGNGTYGYSDVPVAVEVIGNAATVISGYEDFCARLSTSHVDCWGYNGQGDLGNGTTTDSPVPVAVLAAS